MKKVLYVLLVAAAAISCKEPGNFEGGGADAKFKASAETVQNAPIKVQDNKSQPVQDSQKIIKNADLRFETESLDSTAIKINVAIQKYGGYVQNDSQSKEYGDISRSMSIRMPAANFEGFIADVGRGVKHFDKRDITAEDVTEEYIDIEARMKAKMVLEERYYALLRKSVKVQDMLEIEKQISAIREEIDAAEGRLRYMRSRVAMSTVSVEFYKFTETNAGATESYGGKLWAATKSGFNGLSTFLLVLVNIWPLILIFVIAFIIYRKRIRKKKEHV